MFLSNLFASSNVALNSLPYFSIEYSSTSPESLHYTKALTQIVF